MKLKLEVYQVLNRYPKDGKKPPMSGHKILARSPGNALRIARKFGIANPFHRQPSSRDVRSLWANFSIKKYLRRCSSSIWFEGTKGQLLSFKSLNRSKHEKSKRTIGRN